MYDKNFKSRLNETIQQLGGIGKACRAAGVTQPTLDRWKKGVSDPQMSSLSQLAKTANISLDWLVFGEAASEAPPNSLSVDTGDYDYVPFYRLEVSAGDGRFSEGTAQSTHRLAFRKRWLAAKGYKIKDLIGFVARGDSMEPVIKDGASIIVNQASKRPADGDIYVIRVGDMLWVKKTQWLLDGSLRLKSENPAYEDMDISRQDLEHEDIEIIGQVVHTAYDLVKSI